MALHQRAAGVNGIVDSRTYALKLSGVIRITSKLIPVSKETQEIVCSTQKWQLVHGRCSRRQVARWSTLALDWAFEPLQQESIDVSAKPSPAISFQLDPRQTVVR